MTKKTTGLSRTKRTLDVNHALNVISYTRNMNIKYLLKKNIMSFLHILTPDITLATKYHTSNHSRTTITNRLSKFAIYLQDY